MLAARDLVVLGDAHLTRHSPAALAADVARLLEQHMDARIVVAGDLFDLVLDSETSVRAHAAGEVLAAHPPLRAAVGRFLDGGGELWLVGGNHDGDLADGDARETLLDAVAPTPAARERLRVTPWFFRDGDVHIEHGHFYDPDNAPAHPLFRGEPSLGVHFSSEFMRATQAHRFLSSNDSPPLEMLASAFRWYGTRAPYVIYRYFHAAFGALAKSGPFYRANGERTLGDVAISNFAQEADVPRELVERMLGLGARSTLESFAATFARLDLDPASASILAGAGLIAAAGGRRAAGGALAMLGSLIMLSSWLAGHDRYRGAVVDRLGTAADKIAETTGARLVLFGHTHREALELHYANTGSFAYPREAPGRPYLLIERGAHGPRAVRRYLG
jgi:UDP-2,3-diacylglucosamine pyrophosphatase LpxH